MYDVIFLLVVKVVTCWCMVRTRYLCLHSFSILGGVFTLLVLPLVADKSIGQIGLHLSCGHKNCPISMQLHADWVSSAKYKMHMWT